MTNIKREAKTSVRNFDLLEEVKEKLGIDDVLRCNCQPGTSRLSNNVSYSFCLCKCYHICNRFFNWVHIIKDCEDMFCTEEARCEECVEMIERYKIMLQVFRIIFHYSVEDKRERINIYKDKRSSS